MTYERSSISKWLESNDTSPQTRQQMPNQLFPNHSLKAEVSGWFEMQQAARRKVRAELLTTPPETLVRQSSTQRIAEEMRLGALRRHNSGMPAEGTPPGGGGGALRGSIRIDAPPPDEEPLPDGWEEKLHERYQRRYYVNTGTRESTWVRPVAGALVTTSSAKSKVGRLPAAPAPAPASEPAPYE